MDSLLFNQINPLRLFRQHRPQVRQRYESSLHADSTRIATATLDLLSLNALYALTRHHLHRHRPFLVYTDLIIFPSTRSSRSSARGSSATRSSKPRRSTRSRCSTSHALRRAPSVTSASPSAISVYLSPLRSQRSVFDATLYYIFAQPGIFDSSVLHHVSDLTRPASATPASATPPRGPSATVDSVQPHSLVYRRLVRQQLPRPATAQRGSLAQRRPARALPDLLVLHPNVIRYLNRHHRLVRMLYTNVIRRLNRHRRLARMLYTNVIHLTQSNTAGPREGCRVTL